jgi:hypothetical protein
LLALALGFCLLLQWTSLQAGCRLYKVRLTTSDLTGRTGVVFFEFTTSATPMYEEDPPLIRMAHYSFDTVPRQAVGTTGGPVVGDITVPDGWFYDTSEIRSYRAFYNAGMMAFDSLGTFINFDVEIVPTTAPEPHPSQFAFYLTGEGGISSFSTGDPTGANALFTITETDSCEEVEVFTPLRFAGQDSIILDASAVTSVRDGREPVPNPLEVRVSSNPSRIGFQVVYTASAGPVRFLIFDVQGRAIYQTEAAHQTDGEGSFRWNGRDRQGRTAAPGIYFAQVSNRQKSVVRKLCLVP